MSDETCGRCKFYWAGGECHRFPPLAGAWKHTREGEQAWIDRSWPAVNDVDWCGEFQPIPAPPQTTEEV